MLETPVLSSSHYSIIIPIVAFLTGTKLPALVVYLMGVMDNLAGRVNQQVTPLLSHSSLGPSKGPALNFAYAYACSASPSNSPGDVTSVNPNGGTSETARDALLKRSNFSFTDYNNVKPSHIQELDTDFLTWFIGFLEGDGSFGARDSNKYVGTKFNFEPVAQRGEFEITQVRENRPLLMKIRTKLGFGRVFDFEKEGRLYSRFYTSERTNIIRLLTLLNGNLVLDKRREQFKQWFSHLKGAWNLAIEHKESTSTVSLDDAWLAGFSDADAGFHTNVKTNFRGDPRPSGGHYVNFFVKFYITQKGEKHILEKIANLVGAPNKLYTVTNGKTKVKYNRVEIYQLSCVELLIKYFSRFPLRGIRRIACLRWARVFGYKTQPRAASSVGAEKLARLLTNLQYPGEDTLVKDFVDNFSFDEWMLFQTMPRKGASQRRHQAPPPLATNPPVDSQENTLDPSGSKELVLDPSGSSQITMDPKLVSNPVVSRPRRRKPGPLKFNGPKPPDSSP